MESHGTTGKLHSLSSPCSFGPYCMTLKMIMEEQDRTLDQMHDTLSTITEQAGLMGREIGEHVE